MKKYIDEFCKLPADKMAQKMEDMTFLYNETKVPKKHYKDLLQKEIIELLATEDTMQLVLLNAVLNQLQSLKKRKSKVVFKSINLHGLEFESRYIKCREYSDFRAGSRS